MKKKNILPIVILVLGIGILLTLVIYPLIQNSRKNLDGFAQCLRDKGAVMYGAEWCSHCQDQKRLFGDSFRYVSYVECPENAQLCIEKGVEAYPTWIFADGNKFVGKQELEELSLRSGCPLPQ